MLDGLLRELKGDIMAQRDVFWSAWSSLYNRWAPDEITAERYMSQRQGLSNEFINWMLGALWITTEVKLTVYNAATWKMRAKEWLGGEKDAIEQFYRAVGTAAKGGAPDHCIDAGLNGLYYLEKYKGIAVLPLFRGSAKLLITQFQDSYKGAWPQ